MNWHDERMHLKGPNGGPVCNAQGIIGMTDDRSRVDCIGCAQASAAETTDPAEVRHTDPKTGAQKGTKLARFDLVPALPFWELAEHFGRGSRKYDDRNWERGYDWSLSFAALNRHLWAFWNGEDIDPETGSPHITAVAWHAFVLREFMLRYPQGDNRPHKSEKGGAAEAA